MMSGWIMILYITAFSKVPPTKQGTMIHMAKFMEKIAVHWLVLNMFYYLRQRKQFPHANAGTLTPAQSVIQFRLKSVFTNVRSFITQHSLAPEMLHKL